MALILMFLRLYGNHLPIAIDRLQPIARVRLPCQAAAKVAPSKRSSESIHRELDRRGLELLLCAWRRRRQSRVRDAPQMRRQIAQKGLREAIAAGHAQAN